MAISDERQRSMPTMRDKNWQILVYPEAVLLTRLINPAFRGEVCNNAMHNFYYV